MKLLTVFLTLFHSPLIISTNQFHEDLTPEDRLHYFGTELSEQVPLYHYTSPEPIYRRRRRSADDRADLEYLIDIFGETTHLLLEKNTHLISPGCVVEHHKTNGTKDVYPCKNEVDCFYKGRSSNHSNSWVSASVCGGFHGLVGTVDGTFVVQPIRKEHTERVRRDTEIRTPHIVYAHRDRRSCGTDVGSEENPQYRRFRTRRSTARKYIETTVVVEPAVYKFHGKETEQFVKTVMNVAAERFLDPSLQTKLYMTLNKLKILEQSEAGLTLDKDSTVTLNNFCEWQSTWNPKDDTRADHADYVLLLTKLDLEHNGNKANSGLARKGMCGEKTKCSVNEDSGLGTGLTIAHETGHVLGMNHDGSGNSCPNYKNIMASQAATGPDSLKWSQCSAAALKQTLSTSELNCLSDQPPGTADKSYQATSKPGTIYTANHQCRLILGETAEVCKDVHANGQDVCGGIVCRAKPDTGVKGCTIYATPRMDGTDCGNRKWCIQGSCVNMGPGSPGPVNGGWSGWDTQFSSCSRSCGGGVKVKRRYCNNPEPQYGGSQCSGSEFIAELCNVQPCSTSQAKFQEEQCAATDNEPIQNHKYHWIPNTGALGDDSCKMSCQASGTNWYAKRGISHDGTECITDQMSTFSRCVGGKCKVFGCDGHMNSGKKFDQCAVCNGGGNSCTKVSGNFNGGTSKVFTTFVHIPTGSTGITITQGNGYCFLNMKINGHNLFTASAPRSSGTFIVDGIVIKYNKNPERINIVGPTDKYLQAQVYRQYGPPYVGVDPDVYYEYHTPKSGSSTPVYMWKTQAGSCSKQCGTGSQVPMVTCVNQNSGTVADHYCNIYEKPKEDVQQCNTQACPPRWRTSNWGQCSRSCGGGNKRRTVECVEENNNVEKVLPSARCHGIAKPSESSQCNSITCPGVWKAGAWSACSETCARGTKSRDVKCYSSASSTTPVADSQCAGAQKPANTEYCVVKPCRTDISGSSCVDKQANCFQSYGDGVCSGQYKSWAHDNCMKSCGVCLENPPGCKDKVANCAQYQAGFCTNSAYIAWAKSNCQQHCGYCGGSTTTTAAPPANPNCVDKESNCKDYGSDVCTKYAPWSREHCKHFCGMCELTQTGSVNTAEDQAVCADTADCAAYGASICTMQEFAQSHCRKTCGLCAGCGNKKDNCESYGASVCTAYKPWATDNCREFCNLCGARRKRDVADVAPPLAGGPPLAKLELLEDEIPSQVAEATDDSIEEIETLEQDLDTLALENPSITDTDESSFEEEEFKIPPRPVCNTVLTSPSGNIDVTGKLVKGVPCEQTIALPLNSRVSLAFEDLTIDCESGDSLTITDGMTNSVTDMCRDTSDNTWISTGSIAIVRFISSAEGQGYAFSYQSLPRNESVSECSQHLTYASGEVELIRFPANYKTQNDKCEIYITGTPGKNVQFVFKDFKMSGNKQSCGDNEGLLIEDLAGGETDRFCGELAPFMWESRGSRVRLVYSQVDDDSGLSAVYSLQNI